MQQVADPNTTTLSLEETLLRGTSPPMEDQQRELLRASDHTDSSVCSELLRAESSD
jgi:hypothetical protein